MQEVRIQGTSNHQVLLLWTVIAGLLHQSNLLDLTAGVSLPSWFDLKGRGPLLVIFVKCLSHVAILFVFGENKSHSQSPIKN
jgi:hypothetical protein